VRVRFEEPGNYSVTLTVDNACNQPDEAVLNFEVIGQEGLRLSPTPDACSTLSYQPEPFNTDATYLINGNPVPSFPVDLTPAATPYIVEARLDNACGTQLLRDTILVQEPSPVRITDPIAGATFCLLDEEIPLRADRPSGIWRINGAQIQDVFNPQDLGVGTHEISYQVGSGSCAVEDRISVEVLPGPNLDIGNDQRRCIDSAPLSLQANVSGGIWTGPGVVDTLSGVFDASVAGVGLHTVRFSYTSPEDGCTANVSQEIEVVDLPVLQLRDTISVCNADQPIDIQALALQENRPDGGSFEWIGAGFTDSSSPLFDTREAGGTGRYPITLRYRIDPGCVQTDSALLLVRDLTPASAMQDTTLCNTQGEFELRGRPTGGQWRDPSGRDIAGSIDLNSLSPGDYTYTYVLSPGSSCQSSAQTTVRIVAGGSVQAGDDIYVCESDRELPLPNRTGEWSGPALSTDDVIDLRQLAVGSYAYTLTDANLPAACNTDALQVVVTALPEPSFAPDSTGCKGESLRLNNTSTGADRYLWDFGDGQTSTTADPSHRYAAAGTYQIRLRTATLSPVNGQSVCQASTQRQVRIYEAPSRVDFDLDRQQGCSPLRVNFQNRSEGERLQYQWDFGDGQTSTAINPDSIQFETGLYDTTYTVQLQVANGCGGTMATAEIEVFAQPTAEFASEETQQYCSGEEVRIGHRSLGDSLRWDFGNGNQYTGFEPPVQQYFTEEDSDTVRLQLIAYNRCGQDTATQELRIVPTDARASISVLDNRPCVGDTVFLRSLSRPLEAPVQWQFPDGSQSGALDTYYVFQEQGTQRVAVQVFSCGIDSSFLDFEVQPTPEVAIDLPAQSCPGTPFKITLASPEPNTSILFGDSVLAERSQVDWQLDSLGSYTFTARVRSLDGCTARATDRIEIIAGPEAAFSVPDSSCANAPIQLRSTGSNAVSCRWQIDGQAPLSGCNQEVLLAEAGLHDARLLVQSSIGCRDSLRRTMFVRPTPVADFEVEVLRPCTPALVELRNLSSQSNAVEWWSSNGQRATGDTLRYTVEQGGTYTASLRANYDGLCFDTAQRQFTVFSTPSMLIDTTAGCTKAEGYTLTLQTTPNARTVLSGPDYDAEGSLHQRLQAGDYFLFAETTEGCQQDSFLRIPEVQELRAEIDAPDSIFIDLGDAVPLELLVNRADAEVFWSPAEYLSDPRSLSPIARPFLTSDIVATVTDTRGCRRIDQIHFDVHIDRDRGLFIPDGFSPNGDGHNDVFRVRLANEGVALVKSFRIFSPAGGLAFEAEDCDPRNTLLCAWDGTIGGEDAQPGVFGYFVELEYVDGVVVTRKGSVTLLR